jgi:multisubunit Na+/H+ antiporter MnhG subunit
MDGLAQDSERWHQMTDSIVAGLLGMSIGFILHSMGYGWRTWQYWVILALVVAAILSAPNNC